MQFKVNASLRQCLITTVPTLQANGLELVKLCT